MRQQGADGKWRGPEEVGCRVMTTLDYGSVFGVRSPHEEHWQGEGTTSMGMIEGRLEHTFRIPGQKER